MFRKDLLLHSQGVPGNQGGKQMLVHRDGRLDVVGTATAKLSTFDKTRQALVAR